MNTVNITLYRPATGSKLYAAINVPAVLPATVEGCENMLDEIDQLIDDHFPGWILSAWRFA